MLAGPEVHTVEHSYAERARADPSGVLAESVEHFVQRATSASTLTFMEEIRR